ncbi:hypothetical protein [Bosea sp. RAC05]|uniref:hypothetical protein n=1 Tax=Bosea sp. RAC05 TaxID=1842539 RepID=UPI00083D92C6|nr:hypothetical protein [Bosea sp. RAC05]AOG03305.1 hypothetical protein BSY19_4784 [Bosea sp. RAC05]
MSPEDLVRFFHQRRFPLTDEKYLQTRIEEVFTAEGIAFEREVRLSSKDIIDFIVDGDIGIEVKIKGGKRNIYDQVSRYCAHDRIKSVVLLTAVSMGFPPEIDGKSCYVASLGRGWL